MISAGCGRVWRSGLVILCVLILIFQLPTSSEAGTGIGSNGSSSTWWEANQTESASIESIKIFVNITNSFSRTTIRQVMYNHHNYSINDTIHFKIPEKAFITYFTIWINGSKYNAEIMEKESAEKKYNDAVAVGNNAGLILSRGSTKFSYSLSFKPKEKIIFEITYEKYIEKCLGEYKYDLFLSKINKNIKVPELLIDIKLKTLGNFTFINATGDYPKIYTLWSSPEQCNIIVREKDILNLTNLFIRYGVESPPLAGKLLTYVEDNTTFLFHVFSPTLPKMNTSQIRKDIVFVLDKSGSMSGTKIDNLKKAFENIIHKLNNSDMFNIILFESSISSYSNKLIQAVKNNKTKAVTYVKNIIAGGGTNLNDGVELGLKQLKNINNNITDSYPIIVLLTDGRANSGKYRTVDSICSNIKSLNTLPANIYSLGFGFDLDFDFLEKLSLENHGKAIRIYEDIDSAEQLIDFYKMISTPVLKNLTFNYKPDVYDVFPKKTDYMFEGSEYVITGKILGVPGEAKTIYSEINATNSTGPVTFSKEFIIEPKAENNFIPRYWAYSKVNDLLNYIKQKGESNDIIQEIINLSIKYHFLTPYTGLFVEVGSPNTKNYGITGTGSGSGSGSGSGGHGPGSGNSGSGNSGTCDSIKENDFGTNHFNMDSDGDGFCNAFDNYPNDPTKYMNPICYKDTDNDSYIDIIDDFPDDPNEWSDIDGDGIGDNSDIFPYNPFEWQDSDNDGYGDNSDLDPNDPNIWADSDGDGFDDNSDKFPLNPNEWFDTDEDGYGDNSDPDPNDPNIGVDSDGDGFDDNSDEFPNNPNKWADKDGDGYCDDTDKFPYNPNEWLDTDGDGYGDNLDAFPNDPNEWFDTDGDGYGDNIDAFPNNPNDWIDTDGDGYGDNSDGFPNDPSEWADINGDGYCDRYYPHLKDLDEWLYNDNEEFSSEADQISSNENLINSFEQIDDDRNENPDFSVIEKNEQETGVHVKNNDCENFKPYILVDNWGESKPLDNKHLSPEMKEENENNYWYFYYTIPILIILILSLIVIIIFMKKNQKRK